MKLSFKKEVKSAYDRRVDKLIGKQQEIRLKNSNRPKYQAPDFYWQALTKHVCGVATKVIIRILWAAMVWNIMYDTSSRIYTYSTALSTLKKQTTTMATNNLVNTNVVNFLTLFAAIQIAIMLWSLTKIKYKFPTRKNYYLNLDLNNWTKDDKTSEKNNDEQTPVKERHSRHVKNKKIK